MRTRGPLTLAASPRSRRAAPPMLKSVYLSCAGETRNRGTASRVPFHGGQEALIAFLATLEALARP